MNKSIFCFIAVAILFIAHNIRAEVGDAAIILDESDDDVIAANEKIELIEDDDALDAIPQIVEFVSAEYPKELEDAGIKGVVVLELLVNENGGVDTVSIVNSVHPTLDKNAADAAVKFKFSPARLKNGEVVAVMLQYEYPFYPPHKTAAVPDSNIAGNNTVDNSNGGDYQGNIETLDDTYSLTVYGLDKTPEVARHRITITEVKRIPGLGGEATRVVQAMPGVARPSFGGNEVIVRGAPSWATRYFIDGISVPLLYHVGGTTSSYPSEAVLAVDFYPGGYSARYGGQVGGVIEMQSRKPKTDSLHGYADISMLDGAVFLEGPINDRVSFMASARRGFAGDLLALYFKVSDPRNTGASVAPFYWDYLLRTDVVIDENNDLFVTLMGSRDSIGVFVPAMNRGSAEIDEELNNLNMKLMFHTIIAGLDSRFTDRWKNSLRIGGAYASSVMSAFGLAKMEETPYMGRLRNQASFTANDNLTVHLGADIELISENLAITMNSGQNMVIRDTINSGIYGIVGGYANVEWKPIDKLLLVPSIRYDYYPELNNGSVIPAFWDYDFMDNRKDISGEPAFRISGRYEIKEGHTAKAALGSYSQSPEPMGIVIHKTYGEPDLPATKGAHYVAGYEWQIDESLNLDAQSYYNTIWNVARSYNNRIDYDSTREIQRRYFGDGHRRTYGLEIMLRRQRSEKFFGWIAYTLSRSEMWSNLEGKYVLSSNDEPHHLQAIGSWRLKNNWEVGAKLRFVSGKPSSPVVGTVERENDKAISAVYGEQNSTRYDPFFQVDFRVDKKHVYKKWALTYYADFQNVLWPIYKSPEFTYYNYNYTEKQNIAMIPLMAMGIRAEF